MAKGDQSDDVEGKALHLNGDVRRHLPFFLPDVTQAPSPARYAEGETLSWYAGRTMLQYIICASDDVAEHNMCIR
eukprot:7399431-Pyramimonas_sp.AAC.2